MWKKTLVLLGGGHSHALLLQSLISRPIPELNILLVSTQPRTPYSGMLPSTLAGHYAWSEMQIDLRALAKASRVRFMEGEASSIDAQNRQLHLKDGSSIPYDILSITVGAETVPSGPGVSVKPLDRFIVQWDKLLASKSLTIVGGGAAGVEIALSVRTRMGPSFPIQIIQRAATLLPEAPAAVQRKFQRFCEARKIRLMLSAEFKPSDEVSKGVVIWCTPARGPQFLASSSLQRDREGFLLTDSTLRCLGYREVFAAGDVARIVGQERPRAGVYAVRLATPLRANLERLAREESLLPVKLQEEGLAIITRGDRYAVAVRGRYYWSGRWLWYLKRFIDRRFMARFPSESEL